MTTPTRTALLRSLADAIIGLPSEGVLRIAIDGVDGAGKTVFANELGAMIEGDGREVIRASVDSFHNSRAIRYRRGRRSPRGFYLDSYNYPLLRRDLLDPLSPGGNGRYRAAAFDHRSDSPVDAPEHHAAPGLMLIFDGIFLHRPELRNYWDFSVFLRVGFEHSIGRCAVRDGGSPDPWSPENRRYVIGQQLYFRQCNPERCATVVIDNENFASPFAVPRS